MRLAICTLSAALLSGCSWLGYGGHSGGQYGGGSYDAACQQGYAAQYSGAHSGSAGCAGVGAAGYGAGGYGQGAAGYGAAGYGQGAGYGSGAGGYGGAAGYGAGGYGSGAGGYGATAAGYGAGTGYGSGVGGYGAGAGAGLSGYGAGGATGYGAGGAAGYGGAGGFGVGSSVIGAGGQVIGTVGQGGAVIGAGGQVIGYVGQGGTVVGAGGQVVGTVAGGGVTTLGSGASFGSAVGGVTQYAGGPVTQVQGAPIYVPRPYPAYYQTPRLRLQGGNNPIGLAGFAGVSNFAGGDVFLGEAAKPAGTSGRSVSALDAIEYADAFDAGSLYGGAVEYDVSRNTTLFAGANYAQYEGQTVQNGTITQDNSASGGTIETGAGFYEFSDMNELTVEGGVRQYVGGGRGIRPYVGASAGFTHNNDVKLTTTSDNAAVVAMPEEILFINEGWHPTAAGIIGAELAAGPNMAIGVETGVRWTDDRSTNLESDDTWSIPVSLRGRVAF